MSILENQEMLATLSREELVSYLKYSRDWDEIPAQSGWQIFASNEDTIGHELELVLPKVEDNHLFPMYAGNAIDLLSQISEEQPELTLERIQNNGRDVLHVRNTGAKHKSSISINLADRQIRNLKAIIKQGSNSEKNASPYYRSGYYNAIANTMLEAFQFGHTQDRSFGLTIKSPVLIKPIEFRQTSFGFEGFKNEESEPVETLAPVSRRIVERIMRGLVATKRAVKEQNLDLLVHSYTEGFNSNMCKAVVDMSPNKMANIEYSVLWSPRIPPPDDIAKVEPKRLYGVDYSYLREASSAMKKLKPDDTVKVRGTIDGLTSPDNPHKLGAGQSIVIKWQSDVGRVIQVIIDLNPREYLEAIHAHENYQPIEAVGELKEIGGRSRLLNPREFRVVPLGE